MDLWIIDAFADRPFTGNPAGVCWPGRPVPAAWMQAVARELNQAETAFLEPAGAAFGLRWFTPGYEVDLCGHATLAAAHFLWETGRLAAGTPARFHTRSGLLAAEQGAGGITLDFPATPPVPVEAPAGLLAALGVPAATPVLRNQVPQADYVVPVADEAAVRAIVPDLRALAGLGCRGVIVTAAAAGEWDFVSRFFGPGAGVDEDPVTGSAHCTLAPFWAARLGRTSLVGYQASARGGTVAVDLRGDRVRLTGGAITVVRGTITPP